MPAHPSNPHGCSGGLGDSIARLPAAPICRGVRVLFFDFWAPASWINVPFAILRRSGRVLGCLPWGPLLRHDAIPLLISVPFIYLLPPVFPARSPEIRGQAVPTTLRLFRFQMHPKVSWVFVGDAATLRASPERTKCMQSHHAVAGGPSGPRDHQKLSAAGGRQRIASKAWYARDSPIPGNAGPSPNGLQPLLACANLRSCGPLAPTHCVHRHRAMNSIPGSGTDFPRSGPLAPSTGARTRREQTAPQHIEESRQGSRIEFYQELPRSAKSMKRSIPMPRSGPARKSSALAAP
jgi:hypothetical protein